MEISNGTPAGDLGQSSDERRYSSLMRLAQEGDSESHRQLLLGFADFGRRYVGRALGMKLGMDRSACEDVVQDILLAVHSKRHTYDPRRFFLPWFYAIARYKVIDEIRRTAARQELSLFEDVEILASLADPGDAMDIESLLESLPDKQRTLLRLVKLDGLSIEEASRRTGYSASDVKVSIHRAVKALRKKVETA